MLKKNHKREALKIAAEVIGDRQFQRSIVDVSPKSSQIWIQEFQDLSRLGRDLNHVTC